MDFTDLYSRMEQQVAGPNQIVACADCCVRVGTSIDGLPLVLALKRSVDLRRAVVRELGAHPRSMLAQSGSHTQMCTGTNWQAHAAQAPGHAIVHKRARARGYNRLRMHGHRRAEARAHAARAGADIRSLPSAFTAPLAALEEAASAERRTVGVLEVTSSSRYGDAATPSTFRACDARASTHSHSHSCLNGPYKLALSRRSFR